ncbi:MULTISPECIES: hypothetical protein [Burkholderia]|uniref:hypothetical protein n=1 Tax=Burkholderia TaxID=32008 RepID=UPI000F59B9C4|nr:MULTISPECIES: hypothetical protein [Burkholderia]KAB0651263.1 hypothetical protein F7R23_22870 [Burkholderia diffusa]MBM2653744.1 hypothetical protein [Burkholderia diffusa]RQR80222.1 hypothetical protein DIE11_16615 [Burkholderia sp. Bp9012]RQZ57488.1 hypothetical protein DIE08_34785 [Burkholderia sp. Bp9004]
MIRSAEEFVALRNSDIKDEYDRAATDEAPVAVWKDVIDRFPEYRRWVAHNKTVQLEILALLCQYEADVRRFVAVKRKLSDDLFELLSKDIDVVVRQGIASNKKTPISIIRRLAQDEDEDVSRIAKYNLEGR